MNKKILVSLFLFSSFTSAGCDAPEGPEVGQQKVEGDLGTVDFNPGLWKIDLEFDYFGQLLNPSFEKCIKEATFVPEWADVMDGVTVECGHNFKVNGNTVAADTLCLVDGDEYFSVGSATYEGNAFFGSYVSTGERFDGEIRVDFQASRLRDCQ